MSNEELARKIVDEWCQSHEGIGGLEPRISAALKARDVPEVRDDIVHLLGWVRAERRNTPYPMIKDFASRVEVRVSQTLSALAAESARDGGTKA